MVNKKHYQTAALTNIPLGLTAVLCCCHSGETQLPTGCMLSHVTFRVNK